MAISLQDICVYVKGKVPVKDLTNENYISTENMLPNKAGITNATTLPTTLKTQIYQKNDILISNIRPYFKKIWYANTNGGCSNDVLVIRAKYGIDSKFLYYVLADDAFFEYSMVTSKGTKMPRGDKTSIMSYVVPDCDLVTQQCIASILSVLDDKIELNNCINKNLEEQAQAIFTDLFITNANSEWKIGTISDLGNVVGGGTPSKKVEEYYTDSGIAWITPKDLSNDKSKFIIHGETDITDLGLAKSSATLMPKGTVLFSSRAPIGYIAIADGDVSTNQGFKSIVPFENIGTAYIYYFLKENLSAIENVASGSTFKEVSGSTMKNFSTVIPDSDTLSVFRQFCETLFEQQRALEYENRYIATLRDALLPKLMNGEIDVSKVRI